MPNFPFHYTPEHLAVGDQPRWVSATDGDTPTVQIPIRMLGIDAPELHYEGAVEKTPGKYDAQMEKFLTTAGKDLDEGLKAYLQPRLVDKPSTRQIQAGKVASDHFQEIATKRLERKGKNGKLLTPRKLFIMVSTQVFDVHGRLLAYINASYTKDERAKLPAAKRPTFNLQMMQDGQAVSLLIYPNVPKPDDLTLVQAAVQSARTHPKAGSFWKQGNKVILPYEFRWIVDTLTGKRKGPDRYCADITTGKLFSPQQYYKVLPENRLFFFTQDWTKALTMGFQLIS